MAYKDIQQYSELVHEASTFGGADAFKKALKEEAIKAIEKSKYTSGYTDGHLTGLLKGMGIGGVVVGVIAGGVYFGKKIWDGHKVKVDENRKLEKEAQSAKAILMDEDTDESISEG